MSIFFRHGHERAFGTFPLKGSELAAALRSAIEVGYRAIDTAQMYGNEADVGAVLRDCGIPRSELCITTKVHPDHFGEDRFMPSVRESLDKLQVEQVDVLLLHFPPTDGDVEPSLQRLEAAADEGLTRHIGVSNYTAAMMRTAAKAVRRPLVTNQVEFHPLLDQTALLRAAGETGIALSSYCSLARGKVFEHRLFAEIGESYGKTAAQVVLRWILQKGVPINTMSTRPANIQANFEVMDFTLSSIDMGRIDAMTRTGYRIVDKPLVRWAPSWD